MTQGAVRGDLNGESRNRMAGGIAGRYFTSATTCCTNFSPAAGIPWAHLSRCRPQDLIQQQTAGHRGIERVEIVLHGNSYELITKRTLPRGEPALYTRVCTDQPWSRAVTKLRIPSTKKHSDVSRARRSALNERISEKIWPVSSDR